MQGRMKILLGATSTGSLVFAEVEIYENKNRKREYTACFSEVYPVVVTMDYLESHALNIVECVEEDWRDKWLKEYNCRKGTTLAKAIARDWHIESLMDISLYPESYRVTGIRNDIYFESSACGQHDSRADFQNGTIINKELFDLIHEYWDMYHLKQMPIKKKARILELISKHQQAINEREWIQNWLNGIYGKSNRKAG